MGTTSFSLGAAQIGRAVSLPNRAAKTPGRVAMLEGVRQRNTLLDALFYDVGIVTADEAARISPWLAAEGAILIVPPSGGGELCLCKSIDAFAEAGGEDIRTLTVAGVGSSALGSAAFARNIADATGQTAAAVVSGYGLADVAAEALGGFFWFGALNSIRHLYETLDRLTEAGEIAEPTLPGNSFVPSLRQSRDTKTVLSLVSDSRFAFDLLAGHSKGNLVLSEALFALKALDLQRHAALAKAMRIVTVSATIAMPSPYKVFDIMGALDWFGGINSRQDIEADHVVPNAWHHTNTEFPAHLPVTKTLRSVLPQILPAA